MPSRACPRIDVERVDRRSSKRMPLSSRFPRIAPSASPSALETGERTYLEGLAARGGGTERGCLSSYFREARVAVPVLLRREKNFCFELASFFDVDSISSSLGRASLSPAPDSDARTRLRSLSLLLRALCDAPSMSNRIVRNEKGGADRDRRRAKKKEGRDIDVDPRKRGRGAPREQSKREQPPHWPSSLAASAGPPVLLGIAAAVATVQVARLVTSARQQKLGEVRGTKEKR